MSGTGISVTAVCKWLYVRTGNIDDDIIVYLHKRNNIYCWEFHVCNITRQRVRIDFKINRVISVHDSDFKEGDLDEPYLCSMPQ